MRDRLPLSRFFLVSLRNDIVDERWKLSNRWFLVCYWGLFLRYWVGLVNFAFSHWFLVKVKQSFVFTWYVLVRTGITTAVTWFRPNPTLSTRFKQTRLVKADVPNVLAISAAIKIPLLYVVVRSRFLKTLQKHRVFFVYLVYFLLSSTAIRWD